MNLLSWQGFAYVEFLEADAVAAACLLADSELHGRALKVWTLLFAPLSLSASIAHSSHTLLLLPFLSPGHCRLNVSSSSLTAILDKTILYGIYDAWHVLSSL